MPRLVTVSTCSLNQWALDWSGNLDRITESIRRSKEAGASLRVGPELEICGSDCLDSFFEDDLYLHSWEMLGRILVDKDCHDIVLCIGMPIKHNEKRYNCTVFALDGKILLIAPRTVPWSDQNIRDGRYFSLWEDEGAVEEYMIPEFLREIQGATAVPFGNTFISAFEGSIGAYAEEGNDIWLHPDIMIHTPRYYHEVGRFGDHMDTMCRAAKNVGSVHIYSNLKGCGGERVYYEGSSAIIVNGEVISQSPRFTLSDVDVVTATVDLQEACGYRSLVTGRSFDGETGPPSYAPLSLASPSTMSTFVDMASDSFPKTLSRVYFTEAEEIALGPACWLWDYLRRSGMTGFLVPLSGGIDSCSTAIVVYTLCHLIMNAISSCNHVVIKDVQRICAATDRDPNWLPATVHELCNSLLHTLYMGMPQQSSEGSRRRSQALQESIGSYHLDLSIEEGYNSQRNLIVDATGYCPRFQVFGGSRPEDLCLQNIQARLRMVTAYQFGQILPVSRGRISQASLLVLSSTNADEALRGNYTRYDCSSADLNPIGSFSKNHLRLMITWARQYFELPILQSFLDAKPSGELQPITEEYSQNDEQDLEMSYDELAAFATSRKEDRLGPVSMFQKHVQENWAGEHSPKEIASKIKKFHHFAALNRYKTTTLTPAYHATSYSPHNNWCDFRQFLYPAQNHGHAFQRIDRLADTAEIRANYECDHTADSPIMAKL